MLHGFLAFRLVVMAEQNEVSETRERQKKNTKQIHVSDEQQFTIQQQYSTAATIV